MKKNWLAKASLIPFLVATSTLVATSCAFVEQKNEQAAEGKGFGIWNNEQLDFASVQFWNQLEVIKNTGNQFNIWKDLALKNQSAQATMQTEIQFLDVGQADATLIQILPQANLDESEAINNSFNILIDSGNFKSESTADKKIYTPFYKTKLQPTLKKFLKGDDKIDLFMFSHAHADHIGQATQIIDEFSKKGQSIVMNWGDINQNSSTFKKMLATTIKNELVYLDPFVENALDINRLVDKKNQLNQDDPFSQFIDDPHYGQVSDQNDLKTWQANGKKLLKMSPGANIINFAPDNFFAYLAPQIDYEPNKPNSSPNENSINAMLKLANNQSNYRMIFTGDAEGHTHEDMLQAIAEDSRFQDSDSNQKFGVDLYKVAHHGSTTEQSNNEEFLSSITKATTKFIIQTNDNKLFSNSPTLKTQFFKNLLSAGKNNGINDLANVVYISQDLGDMIFKFDNRQNLQAPQTSFISRQEQIKQKRLILKSGEEVTEDEAKLYLQEVEQDLELKIKKLVFKNS